MKNESLGFSSPTGSDRGPRGRRVPIRKLGAWLAIGAVGAGIGTARVADQQALQHGVSPAAELLPTEAGDLASSEWSLPNLQHERVDYWVQRFTTDRRDEFAKFLSRSGKYVPMIEQKLEERGMPRDLIYLAMIESGFNPTAESPAAAVGLWQFIQETGERYGLEVNRAVDERQDPEKSTEAALDYLTYLKNRLGSWYLAAAGYNTGENRVARIMREETGSEKGEEEDYYRIWERLPRETRDYVPLMVAAARISKDPAKYGFDNVELEAPVEYEEIVVDPASPLPAVAEAAGISIDDLKDLNPQLTLNRTRNDQRSLLRVPQGHRTSFLVNWPKVRESETLALQPYKVRAGDSLLGIARRHGVSVSDIKEQNRLRGDLIRAGQTLQIPGRG